MKKSQLKHKDRPLISIVIPTFNHANYLKKALNSVINQTYRNWEIIIVDNHSTDNTNSVISNFKKDKITVLKVNNDGVIAKSRNKGIEIAKGKWIAFLDSDDWWSPRKLEIIEPYLNQSNDFIYHDLQIMNKDNIKTKKKTLKSRNLQKPATLDLILNGNPICNSSVVVRKKILEKIGGLNESKEMIAAEDYNAWIKISCLTDKFFYVSKSLGYYLIHEKGISHKDMSIPSRHATNEFLSLLNKRQKLKLEAHLRYIGGCYKFSNKEYKKSKEDFFFAKKFSKVNIKIKSYIYLMMIYFK